MCGNMKERNHFKNLGTEGRKKLKSWLWSPPTPHFLTPPIWPHPISPCCQERYISWEGVISSTPLKVRKNRWPFCTWFQKLCSRDASSNGATLDPLHELDVGLLRKGQRWPTKNGKRLFRYWLSPENSAYALTFMWLHITLNESHIMQLWRNKRIKGGTWRKETTLKT
jgi:hypothetical protein